MEVGYKLFEGAADYEKIELEMAIFCDKNGYCLEDGYDDGKRYLIINPPYIPPLDDLRADKISTLKAARDAEEIDPIEWNGNKYDYDERARERMKIKRQALEDNDPTETIAWTTADNSYAEIGLADFIAINTLAAERGERLHVKYNKLKMQVLAAETAEEVAAVVW